MGKLLAILDIVLPVFLVIGVGWGLRVVRFLRPEANAPFTRLVFYVAAPALLFRSIATAPLSETVQPAVFAVVAGGTVLVAITVFVAGVRLAPARRGVIAQGAHRSNMVFVGLPIVLNAFGDEVLGSTAVLIGGMVVVYNSLAVLVLLLPHREEGAKARRVWGRTALEFLRNPLILACAAGMAWSASGWGLTGPVDDTLELVGRIAMPLALIAVGVGLDLGRLRAEVGTALLVSGIKLVAYPALLCAALYAVGVGGVDLAVPVLLMSSPTAVVSYIMAREMRGDEELAGSIVIATTLASLVTMSGWLAFFRLVLP